MTLLGLPFIVFAVFRQSPTTIKQKRPEINKWWFWKAIATGFLIHLATLSGVFYWDNLNPQAAANGFALIGVLFIATVVELFLILFIIEIFKRVAHP